MSLHERLVARQHVNELRRKANKARNRANLWTQEELDLAKREGKQMAAFFEFWDKLWGIDEGTFGCEV